MPVSHLILGLAFADAGSRDRAALTAEEMADLLGRFRMLVAFMRKAKGEAVDVGGSGTGRGMLVAENAENGRQLLAEPLRLSISATDEQWAAIQARARGAGCRYPDTGRCRNSLSKRLSNAKPG